MAFMRSPVRSRSGPPSFARPSGELRLGKARESPTSATGAARISCQQAGGLDSRSAHASDHRSSRRWSCRCAVLQTASRPDRDLAEQLARSGRTVEALAIFERIVAENPTDVEVRLWIARLQLRMGRTEEAEAGFRAVVLEHPSDVDARIGLGAALTRRDAWQEALDDPARRRTGRRRECRSVRRARPRLPARRRRPSRPRVLQAGDGARAG